MRRMGPGVAVVVAVVAGAVAGAIALPRTRRAFLNGLHLPDDRFRPPLEVLAQALA